MLLQLNTKGSFHVKSTQKIDDPSGFSSNLVRPMHIQSNLATPNFYPIREVFLELWSVESVNFGEILSIISCTLTPITVVALIIEI